MLENSLTRPERLLDEGLDFYHAITLLGAARRTARSRAMAAFLDAERERRAKAAKNAA